MSDLPGSAATMPETTGRSASASAGGAGSGSSPSGVHAGSFRVSSGGALAGSGAGSGGERDAAAAGESAVLHSAPGDSVRIAALADRLIALLSGCGRVAVAFSAGVDSTVVAQAAALGCGADAVAVTADSPSLACGELDEAGRLAEQIGIRHVVLPTREFDNPDYARNPSNRCYHCKTELYDRMAELLPALGVDCIVNGANRDDLGDHRPGILAAQERQIRSPLIEAGCGKVEVRELARHWGLPVWDKPAAPCLSSRIAYGIEVTPERVRRIDAAERFLKDRLGVRELRVRLEAAEAARIELPLDALPTAVASTARAEIVTRLQALGFCAVSLDLEGFRSGSLNAALLPEQLIQLTPSR